MTKPVQQMQMTPSELAQLQQCVDPWPEPEAMDDGLPEVTSFDLRWLPESFRSWVADVAERMQVPVDFPAVIAVLCLAGAVNRRARIRPKVWDGSWAAVPNLWGGIIALPGLLKSPVIAIVTEPLRKIQDLWWQEHKQAEADYNRSKEEYELRRSAWRDDFKSRTKKHQLAQSWNEDEPDVPELRRLIVNDATVEALHETLDANPAGLLVIRDELTGWWSQLDRQGREGERAFFLQAWNGDTSFTIDRIGRGSIHVPACCLSMLGGIQPGRLRSYLVDAITDGPANDGLIQRFQLLVWPDTTKKWVYIDRVPDVAAANNAFQVFERVIQIDPDVPLYFRFTPDAQDLFIAWLCKLEQKVRGDDLHPALVSHLSKYRSLMPSLACLFELADGGTELVSLEHAKQAASWCAYLESHARRIYFCVVTPQLRAARELATKLKTRKVGKEENGAFFFTCRDVYRQGWSGLDTPESVKRAADVLVDAGWVRTLPAQPGPGRPSDLYIVNPRLWRKQ